MAEHELLAAKVWFRVLPSQLERWRLAARTAGFREISDFYRAAVDEAAAAALDLVPPEPEQ